jgi:VWFA-related protein
MKLFAISALTTAIGIALVAGGQASRIEAAGAVKLDVSVVGDDGRPVSGLGADAFSVREDGQAVDITGFGAMSAGANIGGRTIALVMDDSNVHPIYTSNIQSIARAFVARMNDPDVVGIVRFSHRDDELAGKREALLDRIGEFRAGTTLLSGRTLTAYALKRISQLARELRGVDEGRKVIVCIGAPIVFDTVEPVGSSASLIWPAWVDAMHETARANASVYLIDPTGLTGTRYLPGTGLVTDTGGAAFVNSNDFNRAVDRIWAEAGHYYVLEYAARGPERVLHSIDVAVRGRNLHVHARRFRGDYQEPG